MSPALEKLHLSVPEGFLLWVIVHHCLAKLPGVISAAEKDARSVGEGEFVRCGNIKNVLFWCVTHSAACMINCVIST